MLTVKECRAGKDVVDLAQRLVALIAPTCRFHEGLQQHTHMCMCMHMHMHMCMHMHMHMHMYMCMCMCM